MIVSATVFSAFLSSLVAGSMSDRWGRRVTIIWASSIFSAGSLWLAWAGGPWSLLAGRLMVGAGVGLASHTVPIYISECSTTDQRGHLLTMNNIAITGGQLVAALTCGLFSEVASGWRWMLGLAVVPALVQLLGFLAMPETPRYLVSRNRMEEAERELSSLRGQHHPLRDEIEDMVVASRAGAGQASWRSILSSRAARMSIMLGCLLQATQQLAGINTVMYYSASILVMAGLPSSTSIWLASLTSGINFLFCVFGMFIISRLTRRTILFTSITFVTLSLISISISFQFISPSNSSSLGPIMALVSLCLYLASFSPGLGTLPWVINSEVHPGWCRASAMSLATGTNWATNLLVSATFLSLVDRLGRPATFLLYAGLTAGGGGVLAWLLPETRGVSLEETETLFSSRQSGISDADRSRYSLISEE